MIRWKLRDRVDQSVMTITHSGPGKDNARARENLSTLLRNPRRPLAEKFGLLA